MKSQKTTIDLAAESGSYDILIGAKLNDAGKLVRRWTGKAPQRAAIVSNSEVFGHYGTIVADSLKAQGFTTSTFLMKDGERYKELRTLDQLLSSLANNGITRTDVVIALGGGVVGDLAGFGAAVYLRGIS